MNALPNLISMVEGVLQKLVEEGGAVASRKK